MLFMQGAPKRTSGRSHPWSAPLRATSSVLDISTRLAILKLLKMQGRSFLRFVGIALRLERFTSASQRSEKTQEIRTKSDVCSQVIPVLLSAIWLSKHTTKSSADEQNICRSAGGDVTMGFRFPKDLRAGYYSSLGPIEPPDARVSDALVFLAVPNLRP